MRTKRTSPKELQDAVKRINKHLEAKEKAKDHAEFRDFLRDIVGVRPATMDSEAGRNFWNNVADIIDAQNKPFIVTPTENRGNFYLNPKTHVISYRDRKGRFTSYQSVGLAKPISRAKPNIGQRVYENPITYQVSNRDAHGQWTKKS